MLSSIGEFHMVHYQEMLKKYVHHRILLCLLGKNEWKKLRREAFLAENNTVMKEHDFTELLKAKFDTEIKWEEFGFNRTLFV